MVASVSAAMEPLEACLHTRACPRKVAVAECASLQRRLGRSGSEHSGASERRFLPRAFLKAIARPRFSTVQDMGRVG